MSYPYPPQPPRKLERSRTNKVLGGVCGGVAEYLNMDPTLVRVLTVVISLFTGVPVILYLIALFAIPEADPNRPPQGYPPVNAPQQGYNPYAPYPNQTGDVAPGQPLYEPAPGAQNGRFGGSASAGDEAVWGQEGAPWEQRQPPAPASSTPSASSAPDGTSTWESTTAEQKDSASTEPGDPINETSSTDSDEKRP
ncbi:MAG: PspC domain-containing protein [Propionibacteriaceae bacterium]